MRVHIITNCSSTRLIEPLARVQDLPSGLTNNEAMKAWVELLNKYPKSTTPREQYRGMGFMTLQKTLNEFDIASVHIVTGGLGFTGIDDPIVPYDFSGSPKEEHNITQKVTKEPFALNVWWSMINKERNIAPNGNPVAAFLEKLDIDEVCVIACSKVFLKYIAQDFLSAREDAKNKCKILLTASSIGSVPMQLRPYIVSFERNAINHIPGNRNDTNHRALYHFLRGVTSLEVFKEPSHVLSSSIFGSSEGGKTEQIDIPQTLKDRPELLQFDADTAYKILYREVGPFGGRQNFKGIFLKAKIEAGLMDAPKEAEVDDDALEALGGLNLQTSKSGIDDNTQEAIDLLSTFVGAVRKSHPMAEFAAADICAWAERYTQKKGIKLPDVYSSPIKLVYWLKSYASIVGIVQGDKTYTLEQVTEEAA